MRAGPGHRGGRGAERVEVVLLEILAEKLIRDAKFHAGVARVQDAQGPDPGVQHLGREPAVQGLEKRCVKVVAHDRAFLRTGVTHTLIHGGG